MAQPVLDRRTLNRTLLERQLLLERVSRPASQVIEHLVGMQAQEPLNPHLALWSRIDGFDPAELSGLLERREAVRANTVWRTTIHLVTARDAPIMRALTQPLARRTFARTSFGQALAGLDPDEIAAVGRRMLARRPLTGPELGDRLARRFPGYDRNALALAVRWLVPTVQVPPRGVWGKAGPPTLAPLDRPGAAARGVGEGRPTDAGAAGDVAGAPTAPPAPRRRDGAPLPACLRPGIDR